MRNLFLLCALTLLSLAPTKSFSLNVPQGENPAVIRLNYAENLHNTNVEFRFSSIEDFVSFGDSNLEKLNFSSNENDCEVTVTVEVSVGIVSVSLSATVPCDKAAETAIKLFKEAKKLIAEM